MTQLGIDFSLVQECLLRVSGWGLDVWTQQINLETKNAKQSQGIHHGSKDNHAMRNYREKKSLVPSPSGDGVHFWSHLSQNDLGRGEWLLFHSRLASALRRLSIGHRKPSAEVDGLWG